MKKVLILAVCIVCFITSTGCDEYIEDESSQTTAETTTGAVTENGSEPEVKPEWEKAYTDYVKAEYADAFNRYGEFIGVGLVDIDNNGIPELLYTDDTGGALGGRFILCYYKDNQVHEIYSGALSALITVADSGDMYFFKDFDSILTRGDTLGYGFVTRITVDNGDFAAVNLLHSGISDYAWETESRWGTAGESDILHSEEFKDYLTIEKFNENGEPQSISADEYLSLKYSYISENPVTVTFDEFLTSRYDFFDRDDSGYKMNMRELTEEELVLYFNTWENR